MINTLLNLQMTIDDLSKEVVIALLEEHLDDMRATSPPESIHALDLNGLKDKSMTFWTCWHNGELMGCVALKSLENSQGEIKSMRTTRHARNKGIASFMLKHVIETSKHRGYQRLNLETGTMAFFEPARLLYAKHGFEECGPFSHYLCDPNSMFMTLKL